MGRRCTQRLIIVHSVNTTIWGVYLLCRDKIQKWEEGDGDEEVGRPVGRAGGGDARGSYARGEDLRRDDVWQRPHR